MFSEYYFNIKLMLTGLFMIEKHKNGETLSRS